MESHHEFCYTMTIGRIVLGRLNNYRLMYNFTTVTPLLVTSVNTQAQKWTNDLIAISITIASRSL